MLGGLWAEVGVPDVQDSLETLRHLTRMGRLPGSESKESRALDCGCGIGRVCHHVLSTEFCCVDLVDQCGGFLDVAAREPKAGRTFCRALQDFDPSEAGEYDLVWMQWVAIYLDDVDIVRFLRRSGEAVRGRGGVVVVKDNVTKGQTFWVDRSDSSIMRSQAHMRHLFRSAGLGVIRESRQPNLPKGLFPVMTYVLEPRS